MRNKIHLIGSLKVFGSMLLRLLITIALGLGLLLAVYALPVDSVEANMKKSVEVIGAEAEHYISDYYIMTRWATSQQDNYMDSLMLLEAADSKNDSLVNKALNVNRGYIGSKNPDYVLIEHYISGISFDGETDYPRYWHGYLIFIKPLLSVMDYGTIRIVNGIVQALLLVVICLKLKKRKMTGYILPYILAYLMMMPIIMARCLAYSVCYYIYSVGILVLLSMKEQSLAGKMHFVFLYMGIALAYFDFLTYPIATFGIPAVFCLVIQNRVPFRKKLIDMIGNALSWCFGYGGMWLSKWTVASLITGKNVIADGIGQFLYRTGGDSDAEKFSVLACWFRNYKAFVKTPVTILVFGFLVYMVYRIVKRRYTFDRKTFLLLLPFLLLFLAPVVWYTVALNHSSIHTWFTNKACVVSILALLFAPVYLLQSGEDQNINQSGKKKKPDKRRGIYELG